MKYTVAFGGILLVGMLLFALSAAFGANKAASRVCRERGFSYGQYFADTDEVVCVTAEVVTPAVSTPWSEVLK